MQKKEFVPLIFVSLLAGFLSPENWFVAVVSLSPLFLLLTKKRKIKYIFAPVAFLFAVYSIYNLAKFFERNEKMSLYIFLPIFLLLVFYALTKKTVATLGVWVFWLCLLVLIPMALCALPVIGEIKNFTPYDFARIIGSNGNFLRWEQGISVCVFFSEFAKICGLMAVCYPVSLGEIVDLS